MHLKTILCSALSGALIAGVAAAPANDPWHARARAMLEHAVNVPTVLGRDRVPELANWLADQYRVAGIPDADIRIMPYDHTAALIVRWRAPGRRFRRGNTACCRSRGAAGWRAATVLSVRCSATSACAAPPAISVSASVDLRRWNRS